MGHKAKQKLLCDLREAQAIADGDARGGRMKPCYPDGITCMDDYVGAIVRLRWPIHTRQGKTLDEGSTYVVYGHWRGRLTLCHRAKTPDDPGHIAVRRVRRDAVEVVAAKEEKT